jgi:abhydrolase domain-containing protein 5
MGRSNYQCAKYPMVNRLSAIEPDIPISFIYGASSWIVREPGRIVNERRIVSTVNLHVITGAGHHVYRDTKEKFNELVLGACMETDHRRSAAATAGVGHHSPQTASAL